MIQGVGSTAQPGSHHGQFAGSGQVRGFEYTERTVILRELVVVTTSSKSWGVRVLDSSISWCGSWRLVF